MMKKYYTLESVCDYGFEVFAINSHTKGYKLCWILNQNLGLDFEKTENHKINETLSFDRYKSEAINNEAFNLISNRSKRGYMISSYKSINYFLIINKKTHKTKKQKILDKLREINDILLVFKLDLEKERYGDRFIIHDKKN